LLFIALQLHDLGRMRAALVEQERERLMQAASTAQANLDRQLQSSRSMLNLVRHQALASRRAREESAQDLSQQLSAMAAALDGVRSLLLVDSFGRVQAASRSEWVGLDMQAEPLFDSMQRARDPQALHLVPAFDRFRDDLATVLALVMLDEAGRFAGYVQATLESRYFGTLLKPVLHAPDMQVALVHGGQQLLFEAPLSGGRPRFWLEPEQHQALLHALRQAPGTQLVDDFPGTDGRPRLALLQSMRPAAGPAGHDLQLVLSRDASTLLAGWRRELGQRLALTLLAVLLSLGVLLLHQRRQLASSRRALQHAAEQERFRQLFEQTGQAIMLLDGQGACVGCNAAALALFGFPSQQQMLGLGLAGLAPVLQPDGRSSAELAAELIGKLQQNGYQVSEWELSRSNGICFSASVRATAIRSDGQALLHLVLDDITEQRRARERIEYLAFHDSLTGLPNRALGQDLLQRKLAACAPGEGLAVFYLDLDQFKHVNDRYGHEQGDRLLQLVAQRLRACLGPQDLLCRLGGDEFMLAMPRVGSADQLESVCARLLARLDSVFELDAVRVSTSASIGAAIHPQHGADAGALMRNADTALTESRKDGRGRWRLFEPQMDLQLRAFIQTRDELRLALERQELVLHYQPKVCLASGSVQGFEALLRWQRPGHGLVMPGTFMQAAEDSGLIVALGRWALREACIQAAYWHRTGLPGLMAAVNVSALQFCQGEIERDVEQALADSGMDPALLELELTESVLLQHDDSVRGALERWKAAGIRLAIDDFGTGYSSLAYLKRFELDRIKIDRSFVASLDAEDDRAIVVAMLQIARTLQLRTTAEGVESPQLAAQLRELGCEEGQGYWYSPPLPAAQFRAWVEARNAAAALC
jgi:diguanylate cyclase (GGDEF)-like protein/PAS domain S-box-containing protein